MLLLQPLVLLCLGLGIDLVLSLLDQLILILDCPQCILPDRPVLNLNTQEWQDIIPEFIAQLEYLRGPSLGLLLHLVSEFNHSAHQGSQDLLLTELALLILSARGEYVILVQAEYLQYPEYILGDLSHNGQFNGFRVLHDVYVGMLHQV